MARKLPDRPRVFCIGWHKTGTSTLGMALIRLGYSVLGCRLDMVHPLRRGDLDSVLEVAGQFDALQDVPWAALYRELDQRYPGSRFILAERDEAGWLNSARKHFKDTDIPLHEWLYGEGRLIGNEETYLLRYRRHNQEVREYFGGRRQDLVVMDLKKGDGWEALCGFLGHPIPSQAFPHANKGRHNYNRGERLIAALREGTPLRLRQSIFAVRQFFRDLSGRPDPRNRFHNFRENRQERRTWSKEKRS